VNVGDLQSFLKHLAGFLGAHKGSQVAGEFDHFCDGLEPFQGMRVAEFARFLADAKQYKETGVLPVPPTRGKGRAAPKPAKAPAPTVAEAVAVLQDLYNRATDPAVTYETIKETVTRLDGQLDKPGLIAVARGFGISSGLSTKKAAREKIEAKITDRKGKAEEGRAIVQSLTPAGGGTFAAPGNLPSEGQRPGVAGPQPAPAEEVHDALPVPEPSAAPGGASQG
jgi:hypothetical protein